jgi:selenocysteine-specific elongation factor
VHLRLLPEASHSLKHRQYAQVHLGANQSTAQVLMAERAVAPGGEAFAILKGDAPIIAEYGQPFVLRQPSPARTIGGGTIIAPALRASDRQNHCLALAAALASADPEARLAAFIDLRREARFDEAIESRIGLNRSQCQATAQALVERGDVISIPEPTPCFVSQRRFNELKDLMVRRCRIELERRRPASLVLLSAILSALRRLASPPVLQALVEHMVAEGELVRRGERVGLPTGAELSHRQRTLLTALLAEVSDAGPTPPTLKEFAERHGYALQDLEPLVQVAVDEGMLVRLSPQLVINCEALEGLRQRLSAHFQRSPTAKVGEIREQWGITRKHAVPIFEFFDQCQITLRAGDVRSPGPRVSIPVAEAIA